jgi:hypothetical protein
LGEHNVRVGTGEQFAERHAGQLVRLRLAGSGVLVLVQSGWR